jgi:toxin HigB-1
LVILFSDDNLQKLCENERLQTKRLGAACAKKLRTRLADLGAATSVRELTAGRPHPLHGSRKGQFALDLYSGVRLCFEAADEPIPARSDGSIAWELVTRVRVVFVGDYHDES